MSAVRWARYQRLRARQWRPGRGAAICLLVVGPLLGAIVGAVLRRPPAFPERAEALVVVADSASALGGTRTARVRTLGTVLTSQPVVTAVKLEAARGHFGTPVSGSVSVAEDPAAGSLTVIGDADNGSAATALATSATSYAVMLAGRVQAAANAPYSIAASDFGSGLGTWGRISQFVLSPLHLRVARTGGRFHDGALMVTCSAGAGCGTSGTLDLAAVPHHIYTGAVWARARSSHIHATIFLGGDPRDVATGSTTTLTRKWHRLAVSWMASHRHSRIELGVLVKSHGTARMVVDAASFTEGSVPPSSGQERELFADAGVAVASRAVATGAVAGKTTLSAGLGAGAGLLGALAGCAAGVAARRRQSNTQQ